MQGALAVVGGWLLCEATGRSRTTLVMWTLLVGLAWASVVLRYDLWAVLCVLVAVLVIDRWPGAAGAVLGLGTTPSSTRSPSCRSWWCTSLPAATGLGASV